jgi:PadR family transcriptional regulator PadR
MGRTQLGEVEQWVLLAVLRLGDRAFALDILHELDEEAGHTVSRGSLYRTLERLEGKGLSTWALEDGGPARGGHPRRRFQVTEAGVVSLRDARARLLNLWTGVESALEGER